MTGKPRVSWHPASSTGNPVRDSALAIEPATLEPFLALNRAVWHDGPLSPAELELARLRNAHHVGCVFCKSVRYDVAVADGLTEERALAAGAPDPGSELSPREQLLLAFCDHYLHPGRELTESLQQALKLEFSQEELVHLSVALAHFNAFSRCAVALGGMPDSLPIMEIPLPG